MGENRPRAESLGSRPSHNPFRIIAKFNKTGCNSFSIHSTIQASIETNLEYFCDHMCLDNGNISLQKCRQHLSTFLCVYPICYLFGPYEMSRAEHESLFQLEQSIKHLHTHTLGTRKGLYLEIVARILPMLRLVHSALPM